MFTDDKLVQPLKAFVPMDVTPEGITTDVNAEQPLNAAPPSPCNPAGRSADESEVQPLNIPSKNVMAVAEKSMDCNPLAFWKALPAILVREAGRIIDVNEVQLWNASGPIVCTALVDKSIIGRLAQPLNVWKPMLVNVGGMLTDVRAVAPLKIASGSAAIFVDAKLTDARLLGGAPVTGLTKAVALIAVTLAPNDRVDGIAPT